MRDLPIFQFYRSCLTSRIHLFDFININKDSRLINSNLYKDRRSVYCRTTKFEMRKTALQNTLTLNSYSSNGKQTAERLLIYQVSRCFTVVWSQFWTFSKCLSALETTTNNQEVKRSLHRLQNVNNLPKDYIRVGLTCRSLAELFNFIGLVELQEYI